MADLAGLSSISARTDEGRGGNISEFSDQLLSTRNRDPDQQEHISSNPFRRLHGDILGDRDDDVLRRQIGLVATELGIPHDLPVPPSGLPGMLNRKVNMKVMMLIRRICEYPFRMAAGESRSLWNIHNELEDEITKAFNAGWEQAHRERDAAESVEAEQRYVDKAQQHVYFIQSGDAGAIKIGIARNPEKRLRGLQTSHHEKLHIRVVTSGGAAQEQAYHARFAEHRLHGEWFEQHPDILAEIERLRGDAA